MNRWFTSEQDAAVEVGDATIRIDRSKPQPAIVVTGRVTVASSPRIRSALFELIRKNAWRVLVIDLSSVSHIDISGFAVIQQAHDTLAGIQNVLSENRADMAETVQNLRGASENVRALTETVKQRPWNLVRTTQPVDRKVPQ